MICRKKRINLRQKDLPRLRGFSVRNLENMRTFYEEWQMLGVNSAVATAELREKSEINEERLCQNENFGSASFRCVRILAISESKRSFTCFDERGKNLKNA